MAQRDTGIIIQARMGSDRLPKKSMMDICGKPMLVRVIDRCKLVGDNIYIVTPPEDLEIIELAEENNIKFSLDPSPRDVLGSYYFCALLYGLKNIVRITGDNPMTDPVVIRRVVDIYNQGVFDYVCNNLPRSYPLGLDVEVFSFKSLETAFNESDKREHVTTYIRENPHKFKLANVLNKYDMSGLRLTVDTQEDLDYAREIYSKLGDNFTMEDIYEYSGGV